MFEQQELLTEECRYRGIAHVQRVSSHWNFGCGLFLSFFSLQLISLFVKIYIPQGNAEVEDLVV